MVNITSGDVDLMAYETSHGLYSVTIEKAECSSKTKQVFIVKDVNWHTRLGHVFLHQLRYLAETVKELEKSTVKKQYTVCKNYTLAKMTRSARRSMPVTTNSQQIFERALQVSLGHLQIHRWDAQTILLH